MLSRAAVVGGLLYPPVRGTISVSAGIGLAMLGTALLAAMSGVLAPPPAAAGLAGDPPSDVRAAAIAWIDRPNSTRSPVRSTLPAPEPSPAMTRASRAIPRPEAFSAWLAKWSGILPLLIAEFIVWLGFGGLLPIMPLYFTQHGVDVRLLGVVIAAWPAARLVGEPIFGWIADQTRRVPLMVAGLVVTAIALGLPLILVSPVAFVILRAVAGLATAAYDPAARGYLTDSTPPDRRGEAFGLYGAAQMAGLLLGPAIGGVGSAVFGGFAFVFVFGAVTTFIAAIAVALRVRESAQRWRGRIPSPHDTTEFPDIPPVVYRRAAAETEAQGEAAAMATPMSLVNRRLIAAIVLNLGGYFAGGTYEVIWSLYLQSRGAGLDLIGLTFAMFAVPVLFISPIAGRLVDRRGSYSFVVAGSLAIATASWIYTILPDPRLVIPVILVEASGVALINPALYSIVAAASPRGRTSTAQGIFGASGTVGTIVASLLAGYLASIDIRYPFWVGAIAMYTFLALGLLIGGRSIRGGPPRVRLDPVPTA
jgi:MFS family permease